MREDRRSRGRRGTSKQAGSRAGQGGRRPAGTGSSRAGSSRSGRSVRGGSRPKHAASGIRRADRAASRTDHRTRSASSRKQAVSGQGPRPGVIFGRNPVTEALKSGRPMEKVYVQEGSGGSVGRVLALAKERGVIVEHVRKAALDRMTDGGSHQGVAAVVSAHEYASMEDVFARAEERGEDPFLVILDGIEDPGNLGAIIRTAECAGAHGVIIPRRRAAGLTEAAVKTSAGAVEYIPCVRETNLVRTIEDLKARGIWIFACDMDGETLTECELDGPCAIVIGAEGSGISPLVKEQCDRIVSIPMRGKINSLNASNAAAVLMYEIRRQRDAGNAE